MHECCEDLLKSAWEDIIKPAFLEGIIETEYYHGFDLTDVNKDYDLSPKRRCMDYNYGETPYNDLLPPDKAPFENPLRLSALKLSPIAEHFSALKNHLENVCYYIDNARKRKKNLERYSKDSEELKALSKTSHQENIELTVGEETALKLSSVRYEDYELIGDMWEAGAFGVVCLAYDKDRKLVALKKIDSDRESSWSELKSIISYRENFNNHPNLIKIHDIAIDFFKATQTFHVPFIFYTMEVADNLLQHLEYPIGSRDSITYKPCCLSQLILDAKDILIVLEQLLNGIKALHERGLAHRDIKPENIIFVNGIPKLADMGLLSNYNVTMSLAGTPGFLPPEYLDDIHKIKIPDKRMDLYALGMTAYCCFTRFSPEKYPEVPFESLKSSEGRKVNKIILKACSQKSSERFQTVDKFIAALKN